MATEEVVAAMAAVVVTVVADRVAAGRVVAGSEDIKRGDGVN